MESASEIPVANMTPGTFRLQVDGSWRTHSIFHPETKLRQSADFLLDRSNPLLELKLGSEVRRILFDRDTSTAQCVKMKKGDSDKYCVKTGGRIYLSAGAFHTPRLLVESGIGPGGPIHYNNQVGKNLSDKPFFVTSAFFEPGFSFDGENGLLEIAASKTEHLSSGSTRLGLFESLVGGLEGDLIDLARFERLLLPRYLRFSIINSFMDVVLGFCDNQILNDGLFRVLCAPFLPFYNVRTRKFTIYLVKGNYLTLKPIERFVLKNGCTSSVHGFGVFLADPSSTGEVRVNRDGSLSVDPGYLSSEGTQRWVTAVLFVKRVTDLLFSR